MNDSDLNHIIFSIKEAIDNQTLESLMPNENMRNGVLEKINDEQELKTYIRGLFYGTW